MRQVDVYVPCKHGGMTLCNGAHFDYMLSHGVNPNDCFMAFIVTTERFALDDSARGVLRVPVSAFRFMRSQWHSISDFERLYECRFIGYGRY